MFREIARDQFQLHGYFKADLSDPEIRIVEINPQREVIDLILDVNPGDKYRLNSISFQNEAAFPVDTLRHQFTIADGDIFDISRMRAGLESLQRLYGNHWLYQLLRRARYHGSRCSSHHLNFVDVDEGHIYRTGKLILDGDEMAPRH